MLMRSRVIADESRSMFNRVIVIDLLEHYFFTFPEAWPEPLTGTLSIWCRDGYLLHCCFKSLPEDQPEVSKASPAHLQRLAAVQESYQKITVGRSTPIAGEEIVRVGQCKGVDLVRRYHPRHKQSLNTSNRQKVFTIDRFKRDYHGFLAFILIYTDFKWS